MSENKDNKKPAPGSKEAFSGAVPKKAPEAQAGKAAAAKPIPDKLDGKPAGAPIPPAAPKRPASKEEFPPEEDEEEGEEDAFADEVEDEEDGPLDATALGAPDTSERIILVVDEEGQRRNETVAIITQILPNAEVEVADDPEEALEMMEEGDFDTYVVNFLMPGYSSSPFVKAVANHPEHPLLIGFAADKMSDAVDPKKGLKIIPLKRLFDMDTSTSSGEGEAGAAPAAEPTED